MRKIMLALVMLIALPIAAMAQNNDSQYLTPGGSIINLGQIGSCLNASGKAVPCSDPSALPSTFSCTNCGGGGGAVTNAGTFAVQNTVAGVGGENHIGEVGGNLLPITNTMTTTNANTTTGQSIGGLQTLASAVRVSAALGASGTSGYIQDVTVSFTDAVATSQIEIWFFNANPTGSTCNNDAAFVLANADRDKVAGVANITDFKAGNTAVFAQAHNLAMGYGIASATSLFACVVARGTFAITGTANASLITKVVRN